MATVRRSARRVCYVTGTRAEFGLMRSTLRVIREHPRLRLQLIVTGMHLDHAHGRSIEQIRAEGWLNAGEHATVPWKNDRGTSLDVAAATGGAMQSIAAALARL